MHAPSNSTCSLRSLFSTVVVLLSMSGVFERFAHGEQPRIRLPVTLVCQWPGLSPEEMEALVSHPLETVLGTIPQVRSITTKSGAGRAVIWIKFDPRIEIRRARKIVVEKVKLVDFPNVVKVQLAPPSSGEVLLLYLQARSISKKGPKRASRVMELREAAEFTVRPRLLAVSGVLDVQLVGGLRTEYQVIPSPKRLSSFDLTVGELKKALTRANAKVPVGKKPAKSNIDRSVGQLRTVDDVRDTVLATRAGRTIAVKDVAEVRIGLAGQRAHNVAGIRKVGDLVSFPAVLAVHLQPGASRIKVNEHINSVLRRLREKLPSGVTVVRKSPPRVGKLAKMIVHELQRDLPPGMRLKFATTERLGDVIQVMPRDRVAVTLSGPGLDILRRKADEVRQRMAAISGLADARLEPPNAPTFQIEVVPIEIEVREIFQIATEMREVFQMATGGIVVTQIREGRREYDLVIMAAKTTGRDMFGSFAVRTTKGIRVPVLKFMKIKRGSFLTAIYRHRGLRTILILGDVSDRNFIDVTSDVKKALEPLQRSLPQGYSLDVGAK